jgi:hypothetical protein
LDLFCFDIGAGAGAGVGVDERVLINCPKAAPLGYGYLIMAITK